MSQATEIKVMATAAIQEAYLELVPEFERATGNKVVTLWAPTVDVMSRIKEGEMVDLVIMAAGSVREPLNLGTNVPGRRIDIATSGIGVAVRAGAPRPDISSAEAFERTLLAAKSI